MFGKIKEMLSLEKWIENFEGYLEARIELMKFDLRETLIRFSSKAIVSLAFIVFGLAALVLLNIGLAGLINQRFESQFIGYFILAFFYFAVALIFYLLRNNKGFINKIETNIREAIQKEETDHDPKP